MPELVPAEVGTEDAATETEDAEMETEDGEMETALAATLASSSLPSKLTRVLTSDSAMEMTEDSNLVAMEEESSDSNI